MEEIRDSKGRFIRGHPKINDHHPPYSMWANDLRKAFTRALTPDEMEKCTRRLLELAHHKNARISLRALQMILDRGFGKPKESVEVELSSTTSVNVKLLPQDKLDDIIAILDRQTPDCEIVIPCADSVEPVPQLLEDHGVVDGIVFPTLEE